MVYVMQIRKLDSIQNSLLSLELIQRYRVVPIKREHDVLLIGMADINDYSTLQAIQFHTGLQIQAQLLSEAEIDAQLQRIQREFLLETQVESTIANITPIREVNIQTEITEDNDEPVSNLVKHLFQDAMTKHVSDVHIEPFDQFCRIRFRNDGILNEVTTIPSYLAARVITRLKIMANMNIAERRMPQDGRINYHDTNKMDIRINTCPTLYGEKIVLRILKNQNLQVNIDALGLLAEQQNILRATLDLPQGLILVTGPTGSGKTITLYAALNYLNKTEKNICSIEDPVEIELNGVNQININPKIGLEFATALRSLLRQDPDIIMLGEMRDSETANVALQAAQTGHLVLSTLHTNSAIESMMRLQFMNISTHQIIHSVSLIIAQRLVRKLCTHCKIKNHDGTYQHHGCEHCYHGYSGRTGIFEFLTLNEEIASLLLNGSSANHIQAILQQTNFVSLWQAGIEKVKAGETSYEELMRVVNHA